LLFPEGIPKVSDVEKANLDLEESQSIKNFNKKQNQLILFKLTKALTFSIRNVGQ
jgi:hypothetical protein